MICFVCLAADFVATWLPDHMAMQLLAWSDLISLSMCSERGGQRQACGVLSERV